jgi:hypothetical protein
MPQKVLKFAGINRKVNEFQSSGACEEIINLRPELGGGHKIVKPKSVILSGGKYDAFYEHSFGDVSNQIAVINGIVVWVNYQDGLFFTITSEFLSKEVEISTAGNILLVYCSSAKKQLAFRFLDGTYKSFNLRINTISKIEVSIYNTTAHSFNVPDQTPESFTDTLLKAASGVYGLCGAVVIGCTYELEDGNEIWSTAFVVEDATIVPVVDKESYSITLYSSEARLHLSFDENKYDNVKCVNVYASRPVFGFTEVVDTGGPTYALKTESLSDLNLAGQTLYYQGSVDIKKGVATFDLDFGKSQASNRIMDVNAGCVERTGNAISYNNRFHYFNSEVNHIVQVPGVTYLGDPDFGAKTWASFVKLNDKWVRTGGLHNIKTNYSNNFTYPLAVVKEIAFVEVKGSDIAADSQMFYVTMKESTAYNYSYAFGITPTTVLATSFYNDMKNANQLMSNTLTSKVFLRKEENALNVSAQLNPFVFPVNYSYSFGGEILDITTSFMPISSTQIGQYPLTVFTSSGIFSLEQGSGSVLYSNIVPIQPHVISGKAEATPYGTFFKSAKGVYLLAGRDVVNISNILDGERELHLRENRSYKNLVGGAGSGAYNFSSLLSNKDFEEFIIDADLSYDQLQNELYISGGSSDTDYSYVFNLDTKIFHKSSRRYLTSYNGARYAVETIGDTTKIVDMSLEEKGNQAVLLQSRPLSLELLSTHIQRLILLADASLKDDQYLCISVFGSDNLYDWKCIMSAQKHNTILRHIRTNKAAKSYRDYIILINGFVNTDTDISEIIADYTVVNRRLG